MKNKRILLIGIIFIASLAILFMLLRPEKRLNWRESYKQTSKDPYGAQVLAELLKKRAKSGGFHVLKDSFSASLPITLEQPASYVFVGPATYMTENDVVRLLAFAGQGGHVFMSSKIMPYSLVTELYVSSCDSLSWDGYSYFGDTLARLSLAHPDLKGAPFSLSYVVRNRVDYYAWNYMADNYFCESQGWAKLGFVNDSVANFARLPYERGYIYLHTTPLAFSNYHLCKAAGWKYASQVFAHLPDGPIYWDEYSKVPEMAAQMPPNSQRLSRRGPLQYILSQPSLTWAWYLLLLAALLFLVFRGKRRQRIIPVLAQNKNTSLEFVQIMGRLYFLQNNHRQLAMQMLKLFFLYARERYNLQSRDIDETFVERLKARSEVKSDIIDKIILLNRNIANSQFMSDNTLMELNRYIDHFYKNCK
jgi:hypothetical protein